MDSPKIIMVSILIPVFKKLILIRWHKLATILSNVTGDFFPTKMTQSISKNSILSLYTFLEESNTN